jgi:hypothetical protein
MSAAQNSDPKFTRDKQHNVSGGQFASDAIESNGEPITEPEVEKVEKR